MEHRTRHDDVKCEPDLNTHLLKFDVDVEQSKARLMEMPSKWDKLCQPRDWRLSLLMGLLDQLVSYIIYLTCSNYRDELSVSTVEWRSKWIIILVVSLLPCELPCLPDTAEASTEAAQPLTGLPASESFTMSTLWTLRVIWHLYPKICVFVS